MKCLPRVACVALAGWLLLGTDQSARAQVPGYNQAQMPGFSPYLNLRSGINPAIAYYGIVRPEVQYSNSLYQLGGQQNQLQGQLNNQQNALTTLSGLPPTGHPAGFMTQSKYFMTNGGQGQGNAFGGGGFAGGGFAAPR